MELLWTIKKAIQVNYLNIRKFITELKIVVFKYKNGLYYGLNLILTKNNYKKNENISNLFDSKINCMMKIPKTLYIKQKNQIY
jgi:hypothetical protein